MQDVSCPDSKRLTAYFQHNLPENDALCLTEHLRQCAACRTRIALMSSVPGEVVLPQRAEGETSLPQLATDITGPSAGELSVLSVWGEYRLLEKLGEGGMGTVYKSLHTRLDKTVAVKMLTKRFRGDAQLVGRFEREMKAAGRVNHPNVVQAYDAREIDGTCFLVTEYVDGLNLEQVVGRHGPLPINAACEAVCQAARGLQAVHEQGLVHRDIKPSNLMLARTGTIKLLDLGLARLQGEPAGKGEMTGVGQIMGTADYMAPEQVSDCHSVDIRADIYSLGCTLYKLLTGEVVFAGDQYPGGMEKLAAHCLKAAVPIRRLREDIPAGLAEIVHRTLEKKPENRFATPVALAHALEPFANGANLGALFDAADVQPLTTERNATSTNCDPVLAPLLFRRWLVAGVVCVTSMIVLGVFYVCVANNRGRGASSEDQNAKVHESPRVAEATATAIGTGQGTVVTASPAPLLPSLDAARARKLQENYAGSLGLAVEQANSLGMKLVLIPPGEFVMGAARIETNVSPGPRQANDGPQHKVTLSQPFFLSACEVTQDAYRQVMHANPSHFSAQGDGRKTVAGQSTSRRPVESVSWSEADEFCRKLSSLQDERAAHRVYRLPTEAEWEYACRAGTTTRWYCGDQESALSEYAWLAANADETTHDVGSKRANAWGLYDMHGNVAEWCSDWFSLEYYLHSPSLDPLGPPTGIERTIRGGSWWNAAGFAGSATRVGSPADGSRVIGFRVACEVSLRPGGSEAAKARP